MLRGSVVALALVVVLVGCAESVQNEPEAASEPTAEKWIAPEPVRSAPKNDEPPKPTALTPAEIAESARNSVVVVRTKDGLGTGFVVAPGIVATCLHVVAGANEIELGRSDRTIFPVSAVAAWDTDRDLVLLRTTASGDKLPPLRLAGDKMPQPGDQVVAVGTPEGLQSTVSSGVVSAVRSLGAEDVLQVSAAISPGSSGGPVFNDAGRVLGVTRAFLMKGQNLNFATPTKYVRELLRSDLTSYTVAEFAERTKPKQPANEATPEQTAAAQAPANAPPAPRPTFPTAVAGLRFGIARVDADRACGGPMVAEQLGSQLLFECPVPPVPVPFAKGNVGLTFYQERLVTISLTAMSFEEAVEALVGKYGQPDKISTYNRTTKQWHLVVSPRSPLTAKESSQCIWHLAGGRVVLLMMGEPFVTYVSQLSDELEESSY